MDDFISHRRHWAAQISAVHSPLNEHQQCQANVHILILTTVLIKHAGFVGLTRVGIDSWC